MYICIYIYIYIYTHIYVTILAEVGLEELPFGMGARNGAKAFLHVPQMEGAIIAISVIIVIVCIVVSLYVCVY